MRIFKAQSIRAAHEELIDSLAWNKRIITTEDGEITWECDPISVEITNPLKNMIHPSSSFQLQRCDEYAKQIIEGVKTDTHADKQFEYTFHERLFLHSQYEDVLNRLKKNLETRRAVLYTWIPPIDKDKKDVPCLQSIQLIARDGRLNGINYMRSNDILSAAGPNMYGFARLLEHIATELSLMVGTYTHIVGVPHLYPLRDAEDLKRWI